jgi:hypothetical protein
VGYDVIEIFRVPSGMAYAAWPEIAQLIAPAVDMSEGRHNLATTLSRVATGHMTALVALSNARPIMGCIIQVALYPAEKWLQVPFCGGSRIKEWLPQLVDTIDAFAYNEQCVGVEISGRGGWKRVLAPFGYLPSPHHHLLQKRLVPRAERKAA